MNLTTAVGLVAAFCTTVSYYPQLRKCWETGTAGDLSFRMLTILSAGIALWVLSLQSDLVIIVANVVSFSLLMGILYFKLRGAPLPSVTKGGADGFLAPGQGRVPSWEKEPPCLELCGILGDEAIRRRGVPALR